MARCVECGNLIEDGLDNEFCLDCEPDQRIYCCICDETHWDDNTCRHVFRTDEGWAGPGIIGGNLRYMRAGFFRLLDKTGLTASLREALALNQFSMNSVGNTFFGVSEVEIWLHGKCYRFDDDIFTNEPELDQYFLQTEE